MTALHLKDAVGSTGRNKPVDVAVTQYLLKSYFTKTIPVKGRSCMTQLPPSRSMENVHRNLSI